MPEPEILKKRKTVANNIKMDVTKIMSILMEIDINKFNSTSKYKWKYWSDGYGGAYQIFTITKKGLRHYHEIVCHNVEKEDCYIPLIQNNDHRIFEAIEEATIWIHAQIELMKNPVQEFEKEYTAQKYHTKNVIKAYESLKE